MNKKKEEIDIKDVKNKIVQDQKISKLSLKVLKKKLIVNLGLLGLIMIAFLLLYLGTINIEKYAYITDLKVLSIIAICGVVLLFELALKRKSGLIAIIGIEMLVAAIILLSCNYIFEYRTESYNNYISMITLTFVGYYIIKMLIIFIKTKISDKREKMKNIVKK